MTRCLALLITLISISSCGALDQASDGSIIAAVTPTQTPGPETGNAKPDADGDGLSDDEEEMLGTNPLSVDSDADGLDDFAEVKTHQTDPLNKNSDGDDKDDLYEVVNSHIRNPNNNDDDGDGYISTPTSEGAYAVGTLDDCRSEDANVHPNQTDPLDGLDINCQPDATQATLISFATYPWGGQSSSIIYTAKFTVKANGKLAIDASETDFTPGYHCTVKTATSGATPACNSWSDPTFYTNYVPVGVYVTKTALSWQVQTRVRTCYTVGCSWTSNWMFDDQSVKLGD